MSGAVGFGPKEAVLARSLLDSVIGDSRAEGRLVDQESTRQRSKKRRAPSLDLAKIKASSKRQRRSDAFPDWMRDIALSLVTHFSEESPDTRDSVKVCVRNHSGGSDSVTVRPVRPCCSCSHHVQVEIKQIRWLRRSPQQLWSLYETWCPANIRAGCTKFKGWLREASHLRRRPPSECNCMICWLVRACSVCLLEDR
jgi:hypothetical protein